MPTASIENEHSPQGRGAENGHRLPGEIDIQALAEELFKMLRKDLSIERERRGRRLVR